VSRNRAAELGATGEASVGHGMASDLVRLRSSRPGRPVRRDICSRTGVVRVRDKQVGDGDVDGDVGDGGRE
jgi:hypothetical protein